MSAHLKPWQGVKIPAVRVSEMFGLTGMARGKYQTSFFKGETTMAEKKKKNEKKPDQKPPKIKQASKDKKKTDELSDEQLEKVAGGTVVEDDCQVD
jgi:hypothetical protein